MTLQKAKSENNSDPEKVFNGKKLAWQQELLRSKLRAAVKVLGAALSHDFNVPLGCATGANKRYAEKTGMTARAIPELLKELEREGWVQVVRGGKGAGDTNKIFPIFSDQRLRKDEPRDTHKDEPRDTHKDEQICKIRMTRGTSDSLIESLRSPLPAESPKIEPAPSRLETLHTRMAAVMKMDLEGYHRRRSGFRTSLPECYGKWIAAGADPELDIWPTIERLLEPGTEVHSAKYFDSAVLEAKTNRLNPKPQEVDMWKSRLRKHFEGHTPWQKEWGPKPDETGCRAPADLLQPYMLAKWRRRLEGYEKRGTWDTAEWGPKPGEVGCRAPADLVAKVRDEISSGLRAAPISYSLNG